jgi:pimeloyl-ACP methyl ester carboxylesterase
VQEEHIAEFRLRRPNSSIHIVEGASHSVQSDKPIELARLLTAIRGAS